MKRHLLTAALLLAAASASAQTVTVSKSGTPDHATIAAALTAVAANAATPDVIQILDNSLYDEAISITSPVTIEGNAASRPVIAAQVGPTQIGGDTGGTDGLTIQLTAAGAVTLRNLIIIPSLTSTPADDLLRSGGTNAITGVLENVVVTANNGSNAPVTTSGLTAVSLVGTTSPGDDGAFLAGTASTYSLTGVVITHLNGASTGVDGLVCSSAATSFTIGDGCVFSYNKRLGIQANAAQTFAINAPTTRVLVLGNNGFAGIWFAGAQTVARTINGCNILNTTGVNNTTTPNKGWGIENQSRGTGVPLTISNAIIAGNTAEGILIGTTGTSDTVLNNVTVAANGDEAIEFVATGAGNVTVTDSILAGNGTGGGTNVVLNNGTGTITLNTSALVTSGPQALTGAGTSGTGTFSLNSPVNADPAFASTTFGASDFYRVTAAAYGTAASGSQPLAGGGTYGAVAAAEHWMSY